MLVVLGHARDKIAATLAPLLDERTRIVENPDYLQGMLSSVQAGCRAAPPETEWFLIALGDQPSLSPEVVRQVLAAATPEQDLVIPSYGGRRGHPLLISARYRDEIATLSPEVGLRELMQRHPDRILHLPVDTDAVLHDMDTPEDYERELRRLQQP